MDKLKALHTFIAIADHGSLTSASHHLGVSLPTVVRTLAALERQVGATLFNRTTRRIGLTDEGRRYLDGCRVALGHLADAERALTARRSKPVGRLVVTASVLFGRLHVAPLVSAFLARHPQVTAELVLLDRVVDLVEDGIDVGLRIGQLPDSTLHAVPVGNVRRVVCASPAYLKRHAAPKHPGALDRHAVVRFGGLGSGPAMHFVDGGRAQTVTVPPRLLTNSVDAALDAVVDGVGLGQFLSYMVEPLIRSGRLQAVLQAHEPPAIPVALVYPHSRLLSTTVRLFVDAGAVRLRASLGEG